MSYYCIESKFNQTRAMLTSFDQVTADNSKQHQKSELSIRFEALQTVISIVDVERPDLPAEM